MMVFTSLVMYSTTYMVKHRPNVLLKNEEQAKALAEYRERHGTPGGHH